MKEFLKNVSYSFTANIISMIVGILSVLIFPKIIGVEEYGYYQLYIFYTGYVTLTALGWEDGIYLKFGGKHFDDLPFSKLNTHFWMLMAGEIALYTVLLIGSMQLDDLDKRSIFSVLCICAIVIHARYFLYLILQATNQIKTYANCVITERLFSVLGGLIALLLGYRGYLLLIVLDAAGRFLSLLLIIPSCRKIIFRIPRFSRVELVEMRQYMISGSMVLIATLAGSLVVGIGRYAIEEHWDIATFSKVSLTISISNMATRCINAVGLVMFPTLRRISKERLPQIYRLMNCGLMILIFGMLFFYQPMAFLLEIWLPKYADSVKYAAILLPVCAYECKNIMLVSTYLKTIFADKVLLLINLIAILTSFSFTILTVYVLNSIELAVLSMLMSLMLRCILGEMYLGKKLNIQVWKNVLGEGLIVVLFVLCNWYLGSAGIVLYAIGLMVFCTASRRELSEINQFVKKTRA